MSSKDAIAEVGRAIRERAEARDATGVAALYCEDARLLPPGTPPVEGRAAIALFWRGLMAADYRDLELHALDFDEAGELAFETGTLTATAPGPSGARIPLAGKYLVVWKRDADGEWRILRDIWNFDA